MISPGMDVWDAIFAPFLVLFIYMFLVFYRKRKLNNTLIRKYLIPAITVRLIGCISLGLIYQFYYKGGDTFNFYRDSLIITESFFESPLTWIRMYFIEPGSFDQDIFKYSVRMYFYVDPASFFVEKIAGFINIFTFSTYLGTSIIFSLFSFSGAWAMFVSLTKIYPNLHKELAFAILFVPSVFFWGSGLMKDTISLSALGWLIYGCYGLFIEKKKRNIIIILLMAYLLVVIKIYILISILPAIFIWGFLIYNNKIKSESTRNFLKPMLIIISVAVGLYSANIVASGDKRYNLDNIGKTSQITAMYISYESKAAGGSTYDIGTLDLTPMGMLKIFPQGVIVSLFRPFLWETKNAVMALSALEGALFLYLTLSTFIRLGFFKSMKYINQHSYVFFALVFSITFAFSIGVSTNNFGTLVRYKIPLIPFYLSAILILRNIQINEKYIK